MRTSARAARANAPIRAAATCLAIFALLAPLAMTPACRPPQAAAPTVSLRMRGGPANASVTVDDQLVGPLDVVQAKGIALPPGPHHVSVEAAGFLPRDFVVVAKDAPVVLDVALVPIPD